MTIDAHHVLNASPVIPVVTIDDPAQAVPLAAALAAGGGPVIEVTLRTPAALEAIEAIASDTSVETIVGVGTVRSEQDAERAVAAGAQFIITPGTTTRLLDVLAQSPVPVLPGVATLSEVLEATSRGFTALKWFPAEPLGGAAYLKSIHAVVPEVVFCPTGGITLDSAPGYLSLPHVPCVGGSWLTPADAVREADWGRVTDLAREAAGLSG